VESVVPVKDVVALADAIEKLTRDKCLRKKMGRAGRELAERKFSVNTVIDQHLDIYKKVIELSNTNSA
jgi:glycosyltransferase involved in cell wall biosynthesis